MSEGNRTEYIGRREASARLYFVYEFVQRNILDDGKPVPASLVKNIMLLFERVLNHVPTAFTEDDIRSEWISVKDKLPESGGRVLVYGSRGGIYTAEFRNENGYLYWHKLNSKSHYCNPTHWMPLPEPPKED